MERLLATEREQLKGELSELAAREETHLLKLAAQDARIAQVLEELNGVHVAGRIASPCYKKLCALLTPSEAPDA